MSRARSALLGAGLSLLLLVNMCAVPAAAPSAERTAHDASWRLGRGEPASAWATLPRTPPLEEFGGRQFWNGANQTIAVRTLASTRFVRFQQHAVRAGGATIADWLYYEERPHVNVLVRRADGRFVVFRQRKYALQRETLAPVGGYLEDGEHALAAAQVRERRARLPTPPAAASSALTRAACVLQREVREELGLRCPKWRRLGSYATSANRGGGWLTAFAAEGCVPRAAGSPATRGMADMEPQQPVYLELPALRAALVDGRFAEVKWTATIALALMAMDGPKEAR